MNVKKIKLLNNGNVSKKQSMFHAENKSRYLLDDPRIIIIPALQRLFK